MQMRIFLGVTTVCDHAVDPLSRFCLFCDDSHLFH
uniref:Uncharacterized protein n=1 Tax=Anguilla anguilla TaxID=7936 RepID=A0A0E9XV90_ANGAN